MENISEIIDWIYLPANAECNELWNCLHDSQIHEMKSDLLSQTLVLVINNEYIAEYHKLPSSKFQFSFQNVKSVRVVSFSIWPGKFELPKNINREQESKLIEEYQSKWREESLEWNTFEKTINSKTPVIVSNAFLATHVKQLGFKIQCQVNEQCHEIFIRAGSLQIFDDKHKRYEMEVFEKLGEKYWEAFSKE